MFVIIITYILVIFLFLTFGGSIRSVLQNATFPSFYPPGSLIGITWFILFLLFIIYLYQVPEPLKWIGILYYILVLAWTPIFVSSKSFRVAFYYLLFVWCLTILLFILSKSWILIPQFIWISFATYLSFRLYQLN